MSMKLKDLIYAKTGIAIDPGSLASDPEWTDIDCFINGAGSQK